MHEIDAEDQTCELCGSTSVFRLLAEGRDYLVGETDTLFRAVQCTNCGLVFLDRRGSAARPAYPSSYFLAGTCSLPGMEKAADLTLSREARKLSRIVPHARNILEVGPGRGQFLAALARAFPNAQIKGFDVGEAAGVIPSAERVRLCYGDDLSTAAFSDGQFDLIVMRHVLEHVPAVRGFLCEVSRISADGCVLYLKVPNIESYAAQIFGRHWYGFDFPRHLYYFSPENLKRILDGGSFRNVAIGHENDAIDWAGSIRFLLADWGIGRRGMASTLVRLALLGLRALLYPLGAVAAAGHASSRIWMVARREPRGREKSCESSS
jgi:SAM-dependent methyltransferase